MSKDYKDTLIMPNTELPMKANLPIKEPTIQDFWKQQDIYQKILKKNAKHPHFTLHDGPPYANGNIHVGHALNKVLKDIIVRYKNMNNFLSVFIPGWDTHGLPIENAISKIDTNYDKKLSVIEKRQKCRTYALEQVNLQRQQFSHLGLLTDFKDIYLTLDNNFEKNELLLFKAMVQQDIVYQDYKPVYWSWSSVSSLADAEIEYYDVRSPSIYVAFEVVDAKTHFDFENVYFVIWTTTPWTIPANQAIAINPNLSYVIVKVKDKYYVVVEDLLQNVMTAIEFKDYKIVKTIKGKLLEKIQYTHPLTNNKHFIILADYVSNENGTGLVHNASGFGLDDYYACKKYNIDVYAPMDDFGCYNHEIYDPNLKGMFYLDANKEITERLNQTGSLLKLSFITHSAPHDWRTKKPVMFRATKQWFVNTKALHPLILKTLDKDVSSSLPKTIERIKEMVLNRNEWCISRQRVWGVPIPIIFDENKNPIFDLELIDNVINILAKEGTDVWFEKDVSYFLTKKYLDTKKTFYKEKDTLDVWFDSGSSFSVLQEHHLPFPADVYLEGYDQFRGWFNSSLICAVILKQQAPYKYLLQHGMVLDEKGNKMSKSIGNVISPLDVIKQYGADIFRIWVSTSDYSIDTRFGFNILNQASETYRKIRNTLFRYTIANLHDFDPKQDLQTTLSLEDNYILYCLNEVIKKIHLAYEQYKFIDVIKLTNNFTIELSQWYFDLIKDPLYCNAQNNIRRKQIQTVLFTILNAFLTLLSPIIPHTCEETYQYFNTNNKQSSICLVDMVKNVRYDINEQVIKEFESFFKLKDEVYAILENARADNLIKKNNEASVYINEQMLSTCSFSCEQLKTYLNVAEVIVSNNEPIIIKNNNLCKCQRCWNYFDKAKMANEEICIRCKKVIE